MAQQKRDQNSGLLVSADSDTLTSEASGLMDKTLIIFDWDGTLMD